MRRINFPNSRPRYDVSIEIGCPSYDSHLSVFIFATVSILLYSVRPRTSFESTIWMFCKTSSATPGVINVGSFVKGVSFLLY